MATIKVPDDNKWWEKPYCSGCGEEFYFLEHMLDSNRPNVPPYHPRLAARGSIGPKILEFAKQHEHCPERISTITVSESGVTVLDTRRKFL